MNLSKVLYVCILASTLLACQKEEGPEEILLPKSEQSRLLIINEGNFRSANASLDLYFPESRTFQSDLFSANNQGRPLGDVAQSVEKVNGEYWLVVNNSSKIETIDPNTLGFTGSIRGLNSPRYCKQVSPFKAYVSDLYEDKIYIIHSQLRTILRTIETGGWTEEMLFWKDQMIVCQRDSSQLLIIDTKTDNIINRIAMPKDPHALVMDADHKLWVACSGGIDDSDPALVRVDLDSMNISKTLFHSDPTKSIGELEINGDSTEIFFLMDGLYKMNIQANALPGSPMISENGRNFYALGVDPNRDEIYLSDAIDYQQRGVIYRYDQSGNLLHEFKAGLIPGFFYFDELE